MGIKQKATQAVALATISLLLTSQVYCDVAQKSQKLGFVFEIVRHGARAPMYSNAAGFNVPPGMLTAQGMRQRVLFGRMNRQIYIEESDFLDAVYNPNQIKILSTDVLRTIQSSYSEMMGLYPPQQTKLTQGEKDSIKQGKGLPAMSLRNKEKTLNDDPRDSIDGYTFIPVFNYIEQTLDDDLYYGGCPYANQQFSYRLTQNHTFADVNGFMLPLIRKPIAQAFGITEYASYHMTLADFNSYCDTLLAENMEGLTPRVRFNEEQWLGVRNTQKYYNSIPFDGKARDLWISKKFSKPIKAMEARYQEILNGQADNRDTLRYYIESSHDTQIANILDWLDIMDLEFADVPYGSSMYFELFYDNDCLNSKPTQPDVSCFEVRAKYQGDPILFDTCIDGNLSRNSKSKVCTYFDFKQHLAKITYKGDFVADCAKPYIPGEDSL
eukprot:403352955